MRTAAGAELRSDKRSADSAFDLPFVTVTRVCAFQFRPLIQTSQLELTDEDEEPYMNKTRRSSSFCSSYPRSSSSCLSCQETHSDTDYKQSDKSSVWCADGELLPHSNISVYVHRKLIHVFSRGPEPLAFDLLHHSNTDHTFQAARLFESVVATSKPVSIIYQYNSAT
jgi:hypothetical protein